MTAAVASFLEGHGTLLKTLDKNQTVPLESVREIINEGWLLLLPDSQISSRRQIRRALDFWTAYLRARELSGETESSPSQLVAEQITSVRYPRYKVSISVNGMPYVVEVEARTLLVELLREYLGLTGTHVGCDTSQCGACVVIVDGLSVKSCSLLAVQADGTSVETIEGLADEDGELHPMQEAFRKHHAFQCGFCTPGMIMSSIDLLRHNPSPSETEVKWALDGNLCRCTGYHSIVKAVIYGAELMRADAKPVRFDGRSVA